MISRHAKGLGSVPPCPLDIYVTYLPASFIRCLQLPCLELLPGSSFVFFFVLLKAAAQKSITEAGHELEELVEQLVDLVRSLQSQTHLPEPGPDNEGSTHSLVGTQPGGGKGVPGAGLGTASNWSNMNVFGS